MPLMYETGARCIKCSYYIAKLTSRRGAAGHQLSSVVSLKRARSVPPVGRRKKVCPMERFLERGHSV